MQKAFRVATESERRRAAELEASELKVTIQQLQMEIEASFI
jgi:hypothetical protein